MTSEAMIQVEQSTWAMLLEQGKVLVKSGILPKKIRSAETAIAIIMTGRELGIGTMAALRSIDVIEGTPAISPQLMLALVNRHPACESVEIGNWTDGKSRFCRIKRAGRTAYTAVFGPAEANALGLSGKDNYKKQAGNMYEWRAIAAACRKTFPEVVLGLYTPEELTGGVDTGAGPVIDVQPYVEAPPQRALGSVLAEKPAPVLEAAVVEPIPEEHNAEIEGAKLEEPATVEAEPAAEEIFDEVEGVTKAQLVKLAQLCERLEARGVTEAEWRVMVDEVSNGKTTSRAELTADQATELITVLAKRLNKTIADKAKN